jgi:methionyl-tRNA formyltransferase
MKYMRKNCAKQKRIPMMPKIVFFGTPDIAVHVLEELERAGIVPALVVTNPDTAQGRKLVLTETPVARFAREHSIPILKPTTLKDATVAAALQNSGAELYIVAAYGKIIPSSILSIPKYGTLNVHPSLLPRLRGASPIRSAILENEYPTGVTIMVLTEGLDEGPIVAQEVADIPKETWPLHGRILDEKLARMGGRLLACVLPAWITGTLTPAEQDHAHATYCKKITKDMAEIDLAADPAENLRKIRAFDGWPGAYFFHHKNGQRIRIKIADAEMRDAVLVLTRIIPEGRKEMAYEDWMRSA